MPSQSPKPVSQPPMTQLLPEHALMDTFARAHTFVQPPQWLSSVVSLTQLPEQLVSPAPHDVPQLPDEHTWPPPHAVPHPPQLPLSACVLTSQPFAALPSQLAKPALHAPMTHVPVEHVAPALGNSHLMPHPPQLFTSLLCVAVSQPFDATPSQSPYPVLHAPTTQLLAEQALTDTLGSAHPFEQPPQWLSSVVSLTQLPEQFVRPAPHDVVHVPDEQT